MARQGIRTPPGTAPAAVLLDALGTLLALEPPAPALRRELRRRFGLVVTPEDAQRAIDAEIAYYRAHHDAGRDAASLAALRRRCAATLGAALGPAARDLPLEELTAALLAALRFVPYPDAVPALRALRAAGSRLVVVSNWDVSLHDTLATTGLAAHLDGAVCSAEVGAPKPGGAIFARALALAGVGPAHALHVGDRVDADVHGARAAGIRAVLIARAGPATPPPPRGTPVVRTLAEVPALAA